MGEQDTAAILFRKRPDPQGSGLFSLCAVLHEKSNPKVKTLMSGALGACSQVSDCRSKSKAKSKAKIKVKIKTPAIDAPRCAPQPASG